MWPLKFYISSFSKSYSALRHIRCQVQVPSCQFPIWLMKEFFCKDIKYNLGKILFSTPASHHLSCQKRTELPLPIFDSIPSSMMDLTLAVSISFFINWAHVPSVTLLKASDEAFRHLICCTDIRIFFHRGLSDYENRHHHLNNKIRFLCIILPTPRPPISFGI